MYICGDNEPDIATEAMKWTQLKLNAIIRESGISDGGESTKKIPIAYAESILRVYDGHELSHSSERLLLTP